MNPSLVKAALASRVLDDHAPCAAVTTDPGGAATGRVAVAASPAPMRAAADVCAINVPPGAVRSIATGPPAGSAPCTVTLVAPSATLTFAANGCGLSTARKGFPPTVAVTVTAAAGRRDLAAVERARRDRGGPQGAAVGDLRRPAGRQVAQVQHSAEAAVDRLEARHSEWHGHAVAGRVGDLEAGSGGAVQPRVRQFRAEAAPRAAVALRGLGHRAHELCEGGAARAVRRSRSRRSRARSSTRTAPGRPPCRCARRGWPPRPLPARPAAA